MNLIYALAALVVSLFCIIDLLYLKEDLKSRELNKRAQEKSKKLTNKKVENLARDGKEENKNGQD